MAKSKSSFIDNVIGIISPKSKFKRLQFKQANEILEKSKRKYEGAGRGRRLKDWRANGGSANSEIFNARFILRNRARDLVRNNPYAAKGVQVIQSEIVGRGVRTQFGMPSKSQTKKVNALWKQWASSTSIDFDGRHNLHGLQNVVVRAVVESGEVLIRRRFVTQDKSPVPLQLQVLEADFIDTSKFNGALPNGNFMLNGIEFDKQGRRIAYHLFKQHPGGTDRFQTSSFDTERVPAEEILHIYRQDRPGQFFGVTWFAPIMVKLKDFDDFEDAQLVRQKIAACFSVFIHDIDGNADPISTDDADELGEKVEPGIIEILAPGKTVSFANPPGTTNYGEYTSVILHSMAAGLGITYESFTGNLVEVNFSSARLGKTQMNRNVDAWRDDIVSSQMLNPIGSWFLAMANILGVRTEGAVAKHTPPRKELVDPTKEIPAMVKGIRAGITSLSETVASLGNDPDEHFEQLKQDNEIIDSLKLVLDSDARKVNETGRSHTDLIANDTFGLKPEPVNTPNNGGGSSD